MTQAPDHYVLDDGSERWEVDHQLHREDGPALIMPEGKCWYWHGKLHRADGGPAVIKAHGTQEWWQDGERHRAGAPAVEYADGRPGKWYFKGQMHREDGPAMIDAQGHELWFSHGVQLSDQQVVERALQMAARENEKQGKEVAEAMNGGLQKPVAPLRPPSFKPSP